MLCGVCAIGSTAFCPQGHLMRVKRSLAARGASLGCDECGTQTRRVDLECAFGAHYARHLCSSCAGREMQAVYGSALEPSPAAGPVLGLRVELEWTLEGAKALATPRVVAPEGAGAGEEAAEPEDGGGGGAEDLA